jgi:rod shape-determining protein MreD
MSRIAGSSRDVALMGPPPVGADPDHARRRLLDLLPIVATWPIVPDFAFLVLIAWRLLRPEMWRPTWPCRSACSTISSPATRSASRWPCGP